MKINKLTSTLVALGVLSLAGVAQASNPVIYITGSTAARAFFYNAAKTPGQTFLSGFAGYPKVVSPTDSSGANQIVYEGYINSGGTTNLVDIDCSWTGSEAGIASVAGQGLHQTLANSTLGLASGSYNLPGVPPTFYTQSSGWQMTAALSAIPGAPSVPDLAMADTSQTVSQTPKSLYPLVDYGVVGIIPFTFMKGFEKTADATWSNVVNITTAQINQLIGSPQKASFVTGVSTDSSESVAVCGRNIGSGTRANGLLNFQYGINTPVDQFAYRVFYTAGGVLSEDTTNALAYTPDANGLVEVFNDGFDSGGNVAKEMNIDGTGQGVVLVGYLGVSDAFAAQTATSGQITAGGGNATYLPFNGVYESDNAVINGSYSYWGQEHLLGVTGQSPTSQAGYAATAIVNGLLANEVAASVASGDIRTVAQTAVLAKTRMQVKRNLDSGFPQVGTY
jgi:hypothetical protein